MNIRLHRFPSTTHSFTLVELLVVMGVIAILVGISFNAVSGAWNSANKSTASSQVKALSTAAEAYRVENGIYPIAIGLVAPSGEEPEANPTASEYTQASQALFATLTGHGNWGTKPTNSVYFPGVKKAMVQDNGGADYFIDPWGYAYGYRSLDHNDTTTGQALTSGGYNLGFFDLWSTGGSTGTKEEQLAKWIVNWHDPNHDRYSVD